MKRLFAAIGICTTLILLTGCPWKAEARKGVRLMTYNVGAFGKELEDSAPMIAAMISELGAETVGLNELDSCNRRHGINQATHLADCLGNPWRGVFGRAMAYAGGAYGNGIVSRSKIIRHFIIPLPKCEGSEPRVCVVAETRRYVFAVCHLDHIGKEARLEQARVLTAELERRYGGSRKPVFLAGDFNDTPDSSVIRQLSHKWTLLSPLGDTYSAKEPHMCIDYFFLLHNGARVRVTGGDICTSFVSGDVQVASDHLPVYIDVEF